MATREPHEPDQAHTLDPIKTRGILELPQIFESASINPTEGEGKRIFDRAMELFPPYFKRYRHEDSYTAARLAFVSAAWKELAGKDLNLIDYATPQVSFSQKASITREEMPDADITPGGSYTLTQRLGILSNQLVIETIIERYGHTPFKLRLVPVGQDATKIPSATPLATVLTEHTIHVSKPWPKDLANRQITGGTMPRRSPGSPFDWPVLRLPPPEQA